MAVMRELTEKNFDDVVATGTVLVDFWAPWCSYCRVLGGVIEQALPAAPENAVVLKINIDEHPELAARFNVSTIPTLVLYKDGKLISTCGMVPKDRRRRFHSQGDRQQLQSQQGAVQSHRQRLPGTLGPLRAGT